MFHKIICAVAFSAVSFLTQAVEVLDVLVVFDKNTINGYSELDTSTKRFYYARGLVDFH